MSEKDLADGRRLAATSRGEGTFGLTKKDKLKAGKASAKALMSGTKAATLRDTIRSTWDKGAKKAKSKSMASFDKEKVSKGGYKK